MAGVLNGVRVLEVASWTFTPAAGGVLADWGADVIKVEHPRAADPQRGLRLPPITDGSTNYSFEQPNRGKRSIGLDLATDRGRDLMYRLAGTCDVFLTNYLPRVRAKLQIDVDDIRSHCPTVIYVRGSGTGPRGEGADEPGFDGTSYWARTGLLDAMTPADREHALANPPAVGDMQAGMNLAGGVAAALFQRERTGEPSVVDVSLLASGMWALSASIATARDRDIERVRPPARDQTPNPLSITYRTADNRHIKLSIFQSDRHWEDTCAHLGLSHLLGDERFSDSASRAANSGALVAILDETFAGATLSAWRARLSSMQGAWAVVQTALEAADDPQSLTNGYVVTVKDQQREYPLVANPVQFDEKSPELRPAPQPGADTDEVLFELGLTWDELLEMKVEGSVQ